MAASGWPIETAQGSLTTLQQLFSRSERHNSVSSSPARSLKMPPAKGRGGQAKVTPVEFSSSSEYSTLTDSDSDASSNGDGPPPPKFSPKASPKSSPKKSSPGGKNAPAGLKAVKMSKESG